MSQIPTPGARRAAARRASARCACAALLAGLLGGPALAQVPTNTGSIYSRYGLGERADHGSSQTAALGGAAVAVRSGLYATLGNPALWADHTATTFAATASVSGVAATDRLTDEVARSTAGDLAGLQLGVPLLPGRLGLTLAYRPYSRVNYRAATPGTIVVEGDTTAYSVNQEGGGGLQRIEAGLGLRLGRAVQVGAAADVVFGAVEYIQRTSFDSPDFRETRRAATTSLRGVSATLGATVTGTGVRAEGDALTLGAALSLPTRLTGARTVTLGESLDRDTLEADVRGSATLPLVARAGLGYRTAGRLVLSLDALYEPWAAFESTLPVGGFDAAAGLDELRDRLRVGGGVEFVPSGRRLNASLFARSAYRVGGYAERGLYAPDGTGVQTLALTGGLSMPNRFSGARFDLGFEVGTRGSTQGLLVRDVFAKGTFAMNFGERWFVRRRLN